MPRAKYRTQPKTVEVKPWECVIERRTITAERVATVVARETDRAWWVQCEGAGCVNVITVSKRTYWPADYANEYAGYIEQTQTAPPARRCAACGPF